MPSDQTQTTPSNLTNPDPESVALPTWEEAELALMEERGTALHQFIHQEETNQAPYDSEWRSLLSAALTEIRNAERERCAKVCTDEMAFIRKALGPGDRASCIATASMIRQRIRSLALRDLATPIVEETK